MLVGSPGGSTIIGTVLEILVNRIDLGQSLPDAIAAPRAVERNTATTQAEQAFIDSAVGQELATSTATSSRRRRRRVRSARRPASSTSGTASCSPPPSRSAAASAAPGWSGAARTHIHAGAARSAASAC